MPQAHHRALADRAGAARVLEHQRTQHFAIPFLRMLHVEDRVQREVVPLLRRDLEPAQALIDMAGPRRGGHFDDAQRADRVVGIAAMPRQRDHRVAERERFRHDGLRRRRQLEIAREPFQHRTVHALLAAASHLVPEIARHLELRLNRHLDLGQRQQVVETGFARDLLRQEPFHLLGAGRPGEPGKQRIALAGSVVLEPLEPGDEGVDLGRNVGDQRGDRGALRLDELDLGAGHGMLLRQFVVRRIVRKAGLQPARVIGRQGGLEFRKARAAQLASPRVHPARAMLMSFSSLAFDRDRDHGDAVGAVVGRMHELLAEHIGIDLFVVEAHIFRHEPLAQRDPEQVLARHDGRAGVEQQAAAGREARDALAGDVETERGSEVAAAVPVQPRRRVDQIRRIGDDQIERAVEPVEQVAFHDLDPAHAVQRGIHPAEAQCTVIDVGKDERRIPVREQTRDTEPAGAAAGADIGDAHAGPRPDRGDRLGDPSNETIGVGPEENRIALLGREGRMHEHPASHGGEPHGAAQAGARRLHHAGVLEQGKNVRREIARSERAAPSEHVTKRHGLTSRTRIDAVMARGRDGGEVVATRLQGLPQCDERAILRAQLLPGGRWTRFTWRRPDGIVKSGGEHIHTEQGFLRRKRRPLALHKWRRAAKVPSC